MAAIKALEKWCKMQCDGYEDVAINNMTTSFKNGMAFCALIHKYRPDLIDYESLKKEDVFQNNHLAFRIAEEQLGIPALLDAEDMVALRVPDRLSVLTYVSQYYNYFNGRSAIGCVKPPAEGSKDSPSKKNIPVVSKTFVSKTAPEKGFCPSRVAETSTAVAKASSSTAELRETCVKVSLLQKTATPGNPGKSGTLNSKCVTCRSHVHLVQRHFVDGKLYHRSCFRCSDCSGTLRPGAYRVGLVPDTFVCKSHRDQPKNQAETPSSAATATRDPGPPPSSRSNLFQPALTTKSNGHHRHHPPSIPRPDANPSAPVAPPASVLTTPVASVTPVTPLTSVTPVTSPANKTPTDPSTPRSLSAQKTQAARRRFFETAGTVAEPPGAGWKSWKTPAPAHIFSHSRGAKEKGPAGAPNGNKLSQANCNNNNGRQFTVRSAKRRAGDEPSRNFEASFTPDQPTRQSPARTGTKQPPAGETGVESYCLKPLNIERTALPKEDQKNADLTACQDWRSKLKPVEADPARRDSNPEQHIPEAIPERSPVAVEPPQVLPGGPLFPHPPCGNLPVPARPQTSSCNLAVTPVSSGCPAQSPASSPWPPANQQHQHSSGSPGTKRGKYLSPANASRTEIRSTIITGRHVPTEQIVKALADIEAELGGLEKEGVELEKKLRSCEEDAGEDILMDPVMVEWFNLIRKKQVYIRKESELVYIARTQDLELQQPGVEGELRRLLEKPDHLKSSWEQDRERRLMERLVEIVNGRNAIVEVLDEDRLREVEEDQQLSKMMQNLGVRKSPKKRKSSVSKLFKRRSKRVVD